MPSTPCSYCCFSQSRPPTVPRSEAVMILHTAHSDHSAMSSPLARLAYVTFLLFFLVVVFGTDMPFQERSLDVEDIGTSNQVRQVVYTTLFGMALLALVPRRGQVWRLLCT